MRPVVITALLMLIPSAAQSQDVAAGEKAFGLCKACHQIGENAKNGIGPVLNGVVGRKAGTVEGYNYSPANKNSGLTWDQRTLHEFLKDPKAKMPGTKMVFAGVKDEKRINDLIAYLEVFEASGRKTAERLGGEQPASR